MRSITVDGVSIPVIGYQPGPSATLGVDVILVPGAGGDATSSGVVVLAELLAVCGATVHATHLPFRSRQPRGPAPAVEGQVAAFDAVVATMRSAGLISDRPMVVAGRSWGARLITHWLANAAPADAAGGVCFAYPLHAPSTPLAQRRDRSRAKAAHLDAVAEPVLFVQGAADQFGTSRQLRATLADLDRPFEIVTVLRARHDFAAGSGRGRRSPDQALRSVTADVAQWLQDRC